MIVHCKTIEDKKIMELYNKGLKLEIIAQQLPVTLDYVTEVVTAILKDKKVFTIDKDELFNDYIYKTEGKKKLDIKRCYDNEDIKINYAGCHSTIFIKNKNHKTSVSLVILYVGKNDLSIEQANNVLNSLNINYTLVNEFDWSKMGKGTKVKFSIKLPKHEGLIYRVETLPEDGVFYDFVQETNQVMILVEDKIIVRNADEVKVI